MAIYQTYTELQNFELSNGQTADLVALIDNDVPDTWVNPTTAPEIGTVAYVYAMRTMRRGVVVKTTGTKVHVAITTQGAVDAAMRKSPQEPIRVQIVIADTNYVRVAPPAEPVAAVAEPVAETLDTSTELAQSLIEADHTEAVAVEVVRETTGSAVVRLLERVHERIRQNHPEVPQVVIVTGAGTSLGSAKWGHFRPQGWMTKGDADTKIHEMFMAGETLAKGARQVLQTMLHESAHALAEHRGEQDTSRQGRWHNKVFLKTAQEMGLEHRNPAADKTHGYSFVTLTDETIEEYADLLAELDKEIHLMVRLPGWLGGEAGESGGEGMGKAPTKGTGETSSSNLKLTCLCEEPNIIRASKKVADKLVVKCQDCEEFFAER